MLVIAGFTSTPVMVNAGQSVALNWIVTGATSVSIDQGIGDVTRSTSATTLAASAPRCALTCSGEDA